MVTVLYILDLTLNLDFNKFKDDNANFLIDIYSLLKTYGWCPGNTLEEYIGVLIKNKMGNSEYTFQNLYENFSSPLNFNFIVKQVEIPSNLLIKV